MIKAFKSCWDSKYRHNQNKNRWNKCMYKVATCIDQIKHDTYSRKNNKYILQILNYSWTFYIEEELQKKSHNINSIIQF